MTGQPFGADASPRGARGTCGSMKGRNVLDGEKASVAPRQSAFLDLERDWLFLAKRKRSQRERVTPKHCSISTCRYSSSTLISSARGASTPMYENFKLCPDLRVSDVCLVVEQYSEGDF